MLAHLHHADLTGVLVPWVQHDIERFRHHCGGHSQQWGTPRLKPPISGRTRQGRSFGPVRRKICRPHVIDDQIVWRMKLQQAVARRQIANVNLEVNQDFQQRRGWTLATVDDPATTRVPAARDPQPAIAGQ